MVKKFSLEEICTYLEKEAKTKEEKEKFSPQGLKCALASGRGMGGFTLRMLLIPDSIQVIVSPPACGRHGDFDLLAAGVVNRFFRIRLSEKTIVSGTASKMVCEEVLNLVEKMNLKPKVLSLCITCVDALLNTDYSVLGKKLKEKYNIRFEVVRMFPFLADSVKTHFELLMESVYSLMEVDSNKEIKKAVNIIGKTDTARVTDFFKILNEEGYEVQEIHNCKTIDDYDDLGRACLNVVLNKHSVCAAKLMKKKYGIPYIEFFECFNPEEIKENYKRLGEILGCELNVEEYYQKACEKVKEVHKLIEGNSFAVGGGIDYNPVKFAYNWCKTGYPLKYFLVSKIQREDLQYYQWMKENTPETYVYLATDTTMMSFIDEPDYVKYTLGVQYGLVQKMNDVTMLRFEEEPFDFETLIAVLDQLEEGLLDKNKKENSVDKNVFARNWSTYREE